MAGFAPQAFPTTISSPPLGLSPHSKQKSAPWDCSTIPALQLPATVPSRGPVWGVYGCSKSVQFSFCLDCHRSAALSIRCFSSDTKSCPDVRIRPLLQFPHPLRAGPVLLTLLTLLFPPPSFVLLSFAWFCVFFPSGRHSCPLSAGVLHVLLCLRVCS